MPSDAREPLKTGTNRESILMKTLFVMGTRPEAVKLCPVIRHFRSQGDPASVEVCVTGQHRSMLDQVLETFAVQPEYDLDLMLPGQTLFQSTSRILAGLENVLQRSQPDLVMVQGDTTTTLCGALAATYARVPVGHIEAGLRTGDRNAPFPEEMNRVVVARLATWHFAPTSNAARNLFAEGIDSSAVVVTGNSGIDAAFSIRDALASGRLRPAVRPILDSSRKLILVTGHRRESFGEGFVGICRGLARLARRNDVEIVYPVHRNPQVMAPVNQYLRGLPQVQLIEPLDYVSFIDLLSKAYLVLTDSGGIQEEGPSLGKPILVMREKTERPEAVDAGTVKLVGTDEKRIYREASVLLDNPAEYQKMTRVHNPYGDGFASRRIWEFVQACYTIGPPPVLTGSEMQPAAV
jgi:UDP-N-acetylglucosamine 2-epimerase (non-hydrolysing)